MRSSAPCFRRCKGTRRRVPAAAASLFAVASVVVAACGGASGHGPFFGDEKLIVLGVSPDAEADTLAKQLAERGLREARRVRGKHFTALGFGPDGNPLNQTDVRVITGRGIGLALQARAPTALDGGERYALLRSPALDTLDADYGQDEIYVARTMLPAGTRCLLVYRVLDTGAVESMATDNYQLVSVPDSDPAWREPFCESEGQRGDAGSPQATDSVITAPP